VSTPRDAKNPSQSGSTPVFDRLVARAGEGLSGLRRLLSRHGLELIAFLALLGAGLLILAEFLDVYRVQRGVVIVREQTAGDHHSYALLLAGAVAIVAVLVARSTGAWPPAAAASALGFLALLVFLFGDLPDANSSGLTADARIADAEPAAGLWVELAGAILLTTAGAALALLLHSRAAEPPA
jgi:hypothetical protein